MRASPAETTYRRSGLRSAWSRPWAARTSYTSAWATSRPRLAWIHEVVTSSPARALTWRSIPATSICSIRSRKRRLSAGALRRRPSRRSKRPSKPSPSKFDRQQAGGAKAAVHGLTELGVARFLDSEGRAHDDRDHQQRGRRAHWGGRDVGRPLARGGAVDDRHRPGAERRDFHHAHGRDTHVVGDLAVRRVEAQIAQPAVPTHP